MLLIGHFRPLAPRSPEARSLSLRANPGGRGDQRPEAAEHPSDRAQRATWVAAGNEEPGDDYCVVVVADYNQVGTGGLVLYVECAIVAVALEHASEDIADVADAVDAVDSVDAARVDLMQIGPFYCNDYFELNLANYKR